MNAELGRDNLELYQEAAKMKAFSEGYRTEIRRSLLKYYGEENPAGDQEEYLKKLDYQEYAAADRIQLLEVLISRGLYSQAMSVIEESGYEGIRPESLLRLTSRMLTKCEMAEDEELLALASEYTEWENMMR